MYPFFEYFTCIIIWLIIIGVLLMLLRRKQSSLLPKIGFVDIVLATLLINAIAYLLGFKIIDVFTTSLSERKYTSNEPWGIIWVEMFLDKIINWILLLLIPILFILRHRK